ncbi:hypothetical protein QBC39DRAFT_374903 [Podospora conica]|nr:hypothetical protein QBC39DRAFT_374903 [Schizothecium conicum]
MHLSTALSTLAVLATSATAMPTAGGSSQDATVYHPRGVFGDSTAAAPLSKRGVVIIIELQNDENCSGRYNPVAFGDVSLTGCFAVPKPTKAIRYHIENGNYDCTVTTWSGRDCKGSSFTLQWADVGKCANVVYGSASWLCTPKK